MVKDFHTTASVLTFFDVTDKVYTLESTDTSRQGLGLLMPEPGARKSGNRRKLVPAP